MSIKNEDGADYELIAGLEETEIHAYNGLNQLVEVWKDEETYTYAYNVAGIRVSKTANDTETKFVLDGGNVIAELQDGTVTANYVRGMNLIYAEIDGSTSYYLYNAHGDVTDLTTTTGAVVKSYDYDAFGNEKTPTANDTNPFRYCGEYWDDETGTYYLRARYYNPSVGRFSQQDPILDGLNWYAYCANSPVRFCDPTGLWMEGDENLSATTQAATRYYGELWNQAYQMYKNATTEAERQIYRALMNDYHNKANQCREMDGQTVYNTSPAFTSADAAAIAWAESIYAVTQYVGFEFASVIYSRQVVTAQGLQTYYYYTQPHLGKPHSVGIPIDGIPNGTTAVAVIHSHPHGLHFSPADKNYAEVYGVPIYVATRELEVKKYVPSSAVTVTIGSFTPIPLTPEQKILWQEALTPFWEEHFDKNGNCVKDFNGCHPKAFPAWQ